MKRTKACLSTFKLLSVALCMGLFFYLMIDVWKKYSGKMTSMGSSYTEPIIKSKLLPCLTFCPLSAFKKQGFYFDNDNFIENTFEKEDLFYNITQISDNSSYHLEEIRGISIGRCYMLCYLKEVIELGRIYIGLLKNTEIIGKIKETSLGFK